MSNPQLDIPATGPQHYTLPREVAGRLTPQDFIQFRFPSKCEGFDPDRYTVMVEVLDTSGPPYRSISKLRETVEIPHVIFDPHARIGVVPDGTDLPVYEAELGRGSTYILPSYNHPGLRNRQRIQMERYGMQAPNGL